MLAKNVSKQYHDIDWQRAGVGGKKAILEKVSGVLGSYIGK